MSGGANLIQTHARIEVANDNFGITIGLAPEDQSYDSALSSTRLFIRIKVFNAGTMSANNVGTTLQVQLNGDGFSSISASSTPVFAFPSSLADGANVVEHLTNDGGTYTNGQFDDVNGSAGGVTLPAGNESESVWSVALDWTTLNTGDTIDFRRTSLTTYTVLGSLTVLNTGYYNTQPVALGYEGYLLL